MQGSGRGNLLGPCDDRPLLNDKQRQARLAKLQRGFHPYGGGRIAEARALHADDDEVGWLALGEVP